jgi:hypothetical protein
MERALRIVHGWVRSSIGIANDTLAEVVGLNLAGRTSEVVAGPFPVDFIEVVRHYN